MPDDSEGATSTTTPSHSAPPHNPTPKPHPPAIGMDARIQPPGPGEEPNPHHTRAEHQPRQADLPPPQPPPTPAPTPMHSQFSWSSSLLTMLTVVGGFAVLCSLASAYSTRFALTAAQPMYTLYPSLVAAMLVGGVCSFICYVPTMLAVLCFQAAFDTDIRKAHTPPPGMRGAGAGASASAGQAPLTGPGTGTGTGTRTPVRYRDMVLSLMRDGANTIKLALIIVPIYVMAVGHVDGRVETRSLDAASGGQLAAALMTLRIILVGMREIWDLVPLVVFRWDREAR